MKGNNSYYTIIISLNVAIYLDNHGAVDLLMDPL